MKTLLNSLFAVLMIAAWSGCKKADTVKLNAGAINVTNSVVGGTTLTLLTGNSIASYQNIVSPNNYTFMPIVAGQTSFSLGVPGVAATATAPAVQPIIYYTNTLPVDNTTNYSLFLTGASPSAVDNVLIKESYIPMYTDSVCAVRFINLAPGSNPISVNIKGSPSGSEVSSLAYKTYGDFKQYPAKSVNKTILFEIRDAVTGTLLYPLSGAGFSLNVPYFRNVTLAYRGTGSNVGIIAVNNF